MWVMSDVRPFDPIIDFAAFTAVSHIEHVADASTDTGAGLY
jgi:hypothetical protein